MQSTQLLCEGGGNAANTACAMARLFDNDDVLDDDDDVVNIVTAVGQDANGDTIINGLKENKVNVDYVERYLGSSPFSYILCADVDGESTRTIIHQPSNGDLSIEFCNNIPVQDYTAVHFDVQYPQAAQYLAKKCVELNIRYSVDVERPREGLLELLAEASVVICNSNYVNLILNDDDDDDNDEPKED